MDECDCQEE
jgi:hypothetical protein